MAYMNQERKAKIAAELRKVVPAGWKYSLAVHNHSTLVLTISEAPVDLIEEIAQRVSEPDVGLRYYDRAAEVRQLQYARLNEYYLERQLGASLPVFEAIKAAMNSGNHDNSDPMTDYFDVGWHITIQIGRWDKPFKTPAKEIA